MGVAPTTRELLGCGCNGLRCCPLTPWRAEGCGADAPTTLATLWIRTTLLLPALLSACIECEPHSPHLPHPTMQCSSSVSLKSAVAPLRAAKPVARAPRATATRAAAASTEYPDMNKRNLLNLALVGAVGLPGTCLVGGFAYFFVPPRCVQRPNPRSVRHQCEAAAQAEAERKPIRNARITTGA